MIDFKLHDIRYPNLSELASKEGKPLVFYDLETTGLLPKIGGAIQGIVEIGVGIIGVDGQVLLGETLINPECFISPDAIKAHGITKDQVVNKPTFAAIRHDVANWFRHCVVLGFNIESFDNKYIEFCQEQYLAEGDDINEFVFKPEVYIDVRKIHMTVNGERSGKLADLARRYGAEVGKEHRALGDVTTTMNLLERMISQHGMNAVIEARSVKSGEKMKVDIFEDPIERKIKQYVSQHGRLGQAGITAIASELKKKDFDVNIKLGEMFSKGLIDESVIVQEPVQEQLAKYMPDIFSELSDGRLKPIKDALFAKSGQHFDYNQIRIALRRYKDGENNFMPDTKVETPVSQDATPKVTEPVVEPNAMTEKTVETKAVEPAQKARRSFFS